MLVNSINPMHAFYTNTTYNFQFLSNKISPNKQNKKMGSLKSQVVEDCFGVLKLYSNGSVHRVSESEIDFKKYIMDDRSLFGDGCYVEWEDCIFDAQNQLQLRVYRPCVSDKMMPIVYFFHGGGFCLGSRTWPNSYNYCIRLSSQLQALVIAPDYRLAPEHRLPAAMEDGLNSLKWLQIQAKLKNEGGMIISKLIEDGADFNKVFIIGDSSGGNVAHHLAVHLGFGSPELYPIRIRGYMLLAPFFGGSLRTKSEAEDPPEPVLNLDSLDRFWRLSLPIGETRDHPLANPFGPTSPSLEYISLDPMLVIAGSDEIMKDRVEDYARRLKNLGKDLTYIEFEGQYHGFFMHHPCSQASNQLMQLIKRFMFATQLSC